MTKKQVSKPTKIARCVLTDLTAFATVLLISLYGAHVLHIPAAILIVQLLALELVSQIFPISTLIHDQDKPKKRPTRYIKLEIVTFGLLAGMITYASYLLFFGYHVISPAYIDTGNPLYQQATTVAFVTLAFCQAIHLLFVRADEHDHVLTDYLLSNKRLLQAYGVSLFLILNVVYNPLLQSLLSTTSIGPAEWAAATLCAGVYALIRRLQRYTRKHSRHELVRLQRELNSKR